jgi:Cu/Ag efflux pump CusA
VIGGLLASMFAALFILPQAFAWIQAKATYKSKSLMPDKK